MNAGIKRIFINLILPLLLIAGCVFTIILGAGNLGKLKAYPKTEAEITRITTTYSGEDTEYEVIVKYTVDGKEYERELGSYQSSFREGKKIEIAYNPENPNEILQNSKTSNVLVIVVGSIAGLAGVGMLLRRFFRGSAV